MKLNIAHNRKGMFFTLIALSLVTFFIITFNVYVKYTESDKMDLIETRILTMNDFLNSVEKDLDRAIYISTFRAMVSLANYISSEGEFLSDVDSAFSEIMINGTIDGNASNAELMQGQTLNDWAVKISTIAEDIGLNVSITILNTSVAQKTPFSLEVNVSFNISLVDDMDTASWILQSSVTKEVDLEGFDDPLFAKMSEGKVFRAVSKTNITIWNNSALRQHFLNQTYINNSDAPTYLMRLEGDLSSDPLGIETLVDKKEIQNAGLTVLNRSNVDYIYWGSQLHNRSKIRNITDSGHPSFVLDDAHVDLYNVNESVY